VPGLSENINIISIVDKFLEHGRVYIFHNGGREKIYLSSADWMKRNLSRRIETAFPVYDKELQKIIKGIINIQLNDNVKARIIDEKQTNEYMHNGSSRLIRSQLEIYDYLKSKNKELLD
jgi:polyphosphate kinase